MSKFFGVVTGLYGILVKYPAIAGGLATILVAMASTFGLHWTTEQVVSVVSFTAAVVGLLIHLNVIPVAKAKKGDVPPKVETAVLEKVMKNGTK